MPKKPKINKRLDDLFKDVKPEEHAKGKATKPKVQKDAPPPPPADPKPASPAQSAAKPVKTTRRQTGTLTLPSEFVTVFSSQVVK